jgi:hypothetical protein
MPTSFFSTRRYFLRFFGHLFSCSFWPSSFDRFLSEWQKACFSRPAALARVFAWSLLVFLDRFSACSWPQLAMPVRLSGEDSSAGATVRSSGKAGASPSTPSGVTMIESGALRGRSFSQQLVGLWAAGALQSDFLQLLLQFFFGQLAAF